MSAAPASRIAVQLGPLRLRAPVLTASGTSGYGLDLIPYMDITRLGGIITKSLSVAPREGNRPARLAERRPGCSTRSGCRTSGWRPS